MQLILQKGDLLLHAKQWQRRAYKNSTQYFHFEDAHPGCITQILDLPECRLTNNLHYNAAYL